MRSMLRYSMLRTRHYLSALVLGLLTWACVITGDAAEPQPSSPKEVRLALVTSGRCGNALVAALSAAESQIASDKGLTLLNRQDIDKVLDEHKIVLSGVVDAETVGKTCKVLATDLLVVLEGTSDKRDDRPLAIVVFDARTGARLCDEALASGAPGRWPDQITSAVQTAVKKYRSPPHEVVLLSLVGVRNVDLPIEQDVFCEAVGRLVEQCLLRSPDVGILERRHLGHVLRERAVSPEAPTNALLPSMQTIQLEVSQQPKDGIGLNAILTDAAGQTIDVKTTGERRAVLVAVFDLSNRILKTLKAKPPQGQLNLVMETERLGREAVSEYYAGHFDRTAVCVEATMAIFPNAPGFAPIAARHFANRAMYLLNPKKVGPGQDWYDPGEVSPESVEKAAASLLRCVDLLAEACRAAAAGNGLAAFQPLFFDSWYESLPDRMMMLIRAPGQRTKAASELSERLFDHFERFMVETFIPAWPKVWQRNFSIKTARLSVVSLQKGPMYLRTSKLWTDLLIEHAQGVMKFVDERDPGLARNDHQAFSYIYLLMPMTYGGQDRALWQLTHDDYQRLREQFDRMTKHRAAGMNLFGMSGLLWADQNDGGLAPEEISRRARAIVAAGKLKMNDKGLSDAERVACYEALLNVANTAALAEEERFDLLDEIFDLMLSRQEAVEGVVEMAAFPKWVIRYGNYYPPAYGNIPVSGIAMDRPKHNLSATFKAVNRLDSLLRSNSVRFPDGCGGEIRLRARTALDDCARLAPSLLSDATFAKSPWIKAQRLLPSKETTALGETFMSQPVVEGNDAYVAVNRLYGGKVELMRVSLDSGNATRISEIDLPSPTSRVDGWEGELRRKYPLRSPQISDGKLYCSTPCQGGIVVFPLNGSKPTRLSKETVEGMPTDVFDDVVVAKQGILAMTSGFTPYVHWYDPGDAGWKVIASSRRAERKTLLDVTPLTFLANWICDAERNRVLFSLCPYNSLAEPGLYQFDVGTRQISKVTAFRRWADWMSVQHDGRLWCAFCGIRRGMDYSRGEYAIYEFDPKSDHWREVFCLHQRHDALIDGAERVAAATPNTAEFKPPFVLIDGWLWSFDPFGRMSPDGTVVERFRDVLEQKTAPHPGMTDFNVLRYLPDRRAILYGDKRNLWLLQLPKQAEPPKTAAATQ